MAAVYTPAKALDHRVTRIEDTAAWQRVHQLAGRAHLAVVAYRPDIALASAGEISSIASRRLRQLGGDAA